MRPFFIAVGIILAAGICGAAGRQWACEGGPEFVRFVRSYDFVDQLPAAERTAYRRDLVTPMVELMLPRVSIPRNWIVDSKGTMHWEQRGYDSQDTEWEKRLMDVLAKTATAQ